jgi:starch phosphorylase
VYLHDYDLGMAARLVRGLRSPAQPAAPADEGQRDQRDESGHQRRPELSALDGWWAEAYDGTNGWALSGEVQVDHGAQDARDAAALYDVPEQDVLPAFYVCEAEGAPRSRLALARIRASMRTLAPGFCAGPMFDDYLDMVYAPTRASA